MGQKRAREGTKVEAKVFEQKETKVTKIFCPGGTGTG
jgi:hypothetical protein